MSVRDLHYIQLSPAQWLVIRAETLTPRWIIVKAPLVHRDSGETHVMHSVWSWSIHKDKREVLSVHDGLMAAQRWCYDQTAPDEHYQQEIHRLSVHQRGLQK